MGNGRPSRLHVAVVVAFVVLFMLLLRDTAMRPRRPALPAPLDAHAALREVLERAAVRIGELHDLSEGRQIERMKDVAAGLREEFELHSRLEDAILYETAARRGQAGEVAALRLEHAILGRWAAELVALAERPMPDPHAFARRAERLLGLLEAHLEVEERLLQGVSTGS